MAREMSRRSFLAPAEESDVESRIAAKYRSELAAEVKLREAAEKLSKEAESRAVQAELDRKVLVDKLASTKEALDGERQTAERREQNLASVLVKEREAITEEIKTLHENLASLQAAFQSLEMPVVDNQDIRSMLDQVMIQLKQLQAKPRETLRLKEPMPSFDFTPAYGQYGQIVGIRATPVS